MCPFSKANCSLYGSFPFNFFKSVFYAFYTTIHIKVGILISCVKNL